MPVPNYFENRLAAKRYSAARPNIHPTALGKFAAFAGIELPVGNALDVGCGTGQSTVALAAVAQRVVGIDPSDEMLAGCGSHPSIEYRRVAAESIPTGDDEFDLITVAQAFHWLDQDAFLAEARRVLRSAGWLVIYTSWFTAEMKGNVAFADWFRGQYLSCYPTPPRNRAPITDKHALEHGLSLRGEEGFSDEVSMTIRRFTDYQLSTTNVIAAVKEQRELFEETDRWIASSIEPYFEGQEEQTFLFSGKIWYLEKNAA
jgi:SAM-dependent methyltransferase